jgi:hypothetical protein
MDEVAVPADEPWILEDGTQVMIPQETHPQCLLPDMLVAGEFVAGIISRYQGPVYELTTAKGHRLTVTPNHPIATVQGLIPAYALAEGDQVLSDERPFWRSISLGQPDNNQAPTTIKNVIETLRLRGSSAFQIGRLDLHGDARWTDRQVEIVGADRKCILELDTAHSQGCPKRILQWGAMQQPSMGQPSRRALLLERTHASARGLPRRTELTLDKASINLTPFHPLRVGPSSHDYPTLPESARQGGPAYVQFMRDLLQGSAGLIASDRIVKIQRLSYQGHVYDLQSTTGYIIAESIYISNCRCSWSLVTDYKGQVTEDDAEAAAGWMPVRKYSRDQPRDDQGQWTDVGSGRAYATTPTSEFYDYDQGPRWVGPIAKSGLPKDFPKKLYDKFCEVQGQGPCGVLSDINRQDKGLKIAICGAKPQGKPDTTNNWFPHYVNIDERGAIVDETNPFGKTLDYQSVHVIPATELPDLVDEDTITYLRNLTMRNGT